MSASEKVAIELFHGRISPEEQLDNWGRQGPVFIVDYVHVTYLCDIKLGLPQPAGDGDLHFVEDLVFYDGVYYGDWSVFPVALLKRDREIAGRVSEYDPTKAERPKEVRMV
jgi:hypothetical protein